MPAVSAIRTQWPVVARDAELRECLALLGNGTAGVVVIGHPGVGKTHLARAVGAASKRDVIDIAANITDSGEPYSALAELLARLPENGSPLRRLGTWLESAYGTSAVILRLNDAHLVDPASASVLAQLALSGRIILLATARSGAGLPAAFDALVRDGQLHELPLAPFTSSQAREVLSAVLGAPVAGSALGSLWRASGGNGLLLREIVQDCLATGSLQLTDGAWALHDRELRHRGLAEQVQRTLSALPEEHRIALEVVAITEPIPLRRLLTLVDPAALDALQEGDRIRVEGADSLVRLAHPIFGEVIRELVPPGRRAVLHSRVAEALADLDGDMLGGLRSVLWARTAGIPISASTVVRAATTANRLHDYGLAMRLASAVIEEADVTSAPVLVSALLQRSFANRFAGHAEDALDDAIAARDLGTGDEQVAEAIADLLHYGKDDLDEALAALPTRGPTTQRLLHLGYGGRHDAVLEESAEALRAATGTDRVRIAAVAATSLAFAGTPEAGLRQLYRYSPFRWFSAPPANWLVEEWSGGGFVCLFHSRGVTGTSKYVVDTLHPVQESPFLRFDDGIAQTGLATLAISRGDAIDAVDAATGAVQSLEDHDPSGFLQHALARAAQAHAIAGDLRTAAALADRSEREPARSSALLWPDTRFALLWVRLSREPAGVVLPAIHQAADEMGAAGLWGARAAHLHLALRAGDTDAARLLVDVGGRLDGQVNAAYLRHARAVLDRSAPLLLRASARFEKLGLLPIAAETSLAAVTLARESGLEALARDADRRTAALTALLPDLHSPLLPGADSRSADGHRLTRREREIAGLIAQGASNRDIAGILHLSLRTVEGHLGRIYPKLGLRGRDELAALAAES